ncbi:asparagine synthase (glutamine-hydrolyzing) [Microlunatus soli]|uniref:asparagine synthase (glutamine-hydrolyzing) n=1 Tax=Microlunatus soli TaxID=630515 RepID=A0A1H1XU07_9ACTN|nr:asparagine synthase (glutamine-hydrolyzing) [Microlunatus soli]SDT12216.1 asparagine synthase (glutamine-hydrolysing) [Microlunatus soli]
MCGITGWVGYDHDLSTSTVIDTMTETMACRGPDAAGTWLSPRAALGHRRLSIIDLETGDQPMTADTPNGPVTIVYSGETYNFAELRRELSGRGHRFRTSSDTEVVLHSYLEWGADLVDRLNGMFAFAIWDSRTEKLILARDRMGIKPLYYYPTADGVLFGSEPKAILANPLAEPVVGPDGLREAFTMIKTPGHAIWEGMAEVIPGTLITVDRQGLRSHTYWRLETRRHPDDLDGTVTHVRDLLDDIIGRQLVADVPRCTLLSGGLDSSALTAIAAQQLAAEGERVRSFAVDFSGQEENYQATEFRPTPDAPFVRDVAKQSQTEHADIVLDTADLADPAVRRSVISARDLPTGLGDMDLSLLLLFKAVREHSTVALSGESADEVFGGYRQFFSPVAREGTTFPWLAEFGKYADRTSSLWNESLLGSLDLRGYTADGYASAVTEIERLDGEDDLEWQMRKISYLHLTRFVRVLLDRKDRMSMAVGLEVRVPFCDHRLVEYVYNAPWAFKNYDGREKSLLRGATRDVLPRSVADRVKSPYPSTQDESYATALREQAGDLLGTPNHPVFDLVDSDRLSTLVGRADNPSMFGRMGLERTLDLAVWFDLYRPAIKIN